VVFADRLAEGVGIVWCCVVSCRFKLALAGAAQAFMLTQVSSALLLMAYTIWRDASMAAKGVRAGVVWTVHTAATP
jgi:hypothetical protein